MTNFLAALTLLAGVWLTSSWTLMLLVGVVHAEWIAQLPTLSYALALTISGILLLRGLLNATLLGYLKTLIDDGRKR